MLRIYKRFELLSASSWLEKAMQRTLPTVFRLKPGSFWLPFLPQLLPNMHRQLFGDASRPPKDCWGCKWEWRESQQERSEPAIVEVGQSFRWCWWEGSICHPPEGRGSQSPALFTRLVISGRKAHSQCCMNHGLRLSGWIRRRHLRLHPWTGLMCS